MLGMKYLIAIGFIFMLAVCNLHLLTAGSAAALSFSPAAVMSGEWWRIITHPFVHVSCYHLALDAAAVAILWREIDIPSPAVKFFAACWCGAGSLVAALLFSPDIGRYGLCGLSGTAHGLMLFLGLHWIGTAETFHGHGRLIRIMGGVLLSGIVVLKSLFEVTAGHVIWVSMHGGNIGVPIVESHLGGVVGGIIGFLFSRLSNWPNRAYKILKPIVKTAMNAKQQR